jgi:hypothetical protein
VAGLESPVAARKVKAAAGPAVIRSTRKRIISAGLLMGASFRKPAVDILRRITYRHREAAKKGVKHVP